MLPQVEASQHPDKTYNDGLTDGIERVRSWQDKQDDKTRSDLAIRQQMTLLIPAIGKLLYDHAAQMGERTGQDCPWQVDSAANDLLWMVIEFATLSEFDREGREENSRAHQLTAEFAGWFFEYPPAPEEQ